MPRPRILLVEDDFTLRDLFVRILENASYDVIAAENGHVALRAVEAADPPFDLLITDSRMPVMGGAELISRIRAIHPAMRIIQATGDDRPVSPGVLLLRKPCMPADLVGAVRRVLSEDWAHPRRRDRIDPA